MKMTKTKKLFGVIPPMITPVDENGRIDEKGARNLVNRVIDGGVNGIFALGTMGEFATIDEDQRIAFLQIVVDEAGGRVPILAGVAAEGLKRALRLCKDAVSARPDYIVLMPPYYFSVKSQEELKDYFITISKNIDLPLVIYNNPFTTGNGLTFDTIVELSHEENIVALKDSSSNFSFFMRLIREFKNRDDFSLFQGDETVIDASLIMGADGVVPGIGTLLPDMVVKLYNSVKANNIDSARKIQGDILDIFDGVYGQDFNNWLIGQKFALSHLGLCKEFTTTTHTLLTQNEKDRAIKTLEKYNIK
jgi:dihydrodipicolinate synthase/N-acetylneuraminate lyase